MIDVILPAFNAERTLARTLESLKSQSNMNFRVIAIDDGSNDATYDIMKEYASAIEIHPILHRENKGFLAALRTGLNASNARRFARIDADDEWLPSHVSELARLISANPHASLYCTRACMIGETRRPSPQVVDRTIRRDLMWDNPIVHSTVAVDRERYEEVGGYSEKYRWEDYDLWIRLLVKGSLAASSCITANYHRSLGSLSRIDRQTALSDRFALQQKAIEHFGKRSPGAALFYRTLLTARRAFRI